MTGDERARGLLRRSLDALYLGSGTLAAVAIVGVCVLMLSQVVARELGGQVPGADDLTAWFCAASAFLALAHTFTQGELIRVGLLLDQLGPRLRWWAETVSLTAAVAFCGAMTWWLGVMVWQSWIFGDKAQGVIVVPLWIPQMPVLIGSAVLTVAVIDQWIGVVLRKAEPAYVAAERDRLARGDFSEGL